MTCAGPCQPALSFQQLQDVWVSSGGSQAMAPLMAAIALAESGGVPNNTNPTDNGGKQTSWGLWQVSNGTHQAYPNWSDPTANARIAQGKLSTQGLTAWGTYTNGSAAKILAGQAGTIPNLPSSAATGGYSASQATTGGGNKDSACLVNAPSVLGLGGNCLLNRSQARALIGGVALIPAGILTILGIAWMTGVDKSVKQVVMMAATKGAVSSQAKEPPAKAPVKRSETDDEIAARVEARRQRASQRSKERRQREREAVTRSARAAGERDAERAGPF